MAELHIRRAPLIQTEIEVPGDKSISHRAVILASLSNGPCAISGFLPSEDCLRTVDAMRALGINIEQFKGTTLVVHGRKGNLNPPEQAIDCGNSGTTMRLLAGLLAAQPFASRLTGDESLTGRPMGRVIDPLTRMGARITGVDRERNGRRIVAPPLDIQGGELQAIRFESPVASAQVKSAVLLAGLFARGKTTVVEPSLSRDHTERMLRHFQVNLLRAEDRNEVSIHGGVKLESRDFAVPGDISSAAFWMVAAAAQPGSHLTISRVGLNKTRTGVLGVLFRMGASIREIHEETHEAEPFGKIEIRGARLTGVVIRNTPSVETLAREGYFEALQKIAPAETMTLLRTDPLDRERIRRFRAAIAREESMNDALREEILAETARLEDCVGVGIANVIDELPVLAVAGALAQGTTIIRDAAELTVKESDRIAAIVDGLRAMGARVEKRAEGDGMIIHGGMPLRGARVTSCGDHRIAMAFAIAGLFAEGETVVENTDCISTSYPGFESTIQRMIRLRHSRGSETPVVSELRDFEFSESPPGALRSPKQESLSADQ